MTDGKNCEEGSQSLPPKRSKGRRAKNKFAYSHDISKETSNIEENSNDNGKETKTAGFPADKMQRLTSMLSVVMGWALASMTQANTSQNALQQLPIEEQDGSVHDGTSESKEEGAKQEDELDEYDKSIENHRENHRKDVNSAISKAKDNAILANKITARNSLPRRGFIPMKRISLEVMETSVTSEVRTDGFTPRGKDHGCTTNRRGNNNCGSSYNREDRDFYRWDSSLLR